IRASSSGPEKIARERRSRSTSFATHMARLVFPLPVAPKKYRPLPLSMFSFSLRQYLRTSFTTRSEMLVIGQRPKSTSRYLRGIDVVSRAARAAATRSRRHSHSRAPFPSSTSIQPVPSHWPYRHGSVRIPPCRRCGAPLGIMRLPIKHAARMARAADRRSSPSLRGFVLALGGWGHATQRVPSRVRRERGSLGPGGGAAGRRAGGGAVADAPRGPAVNAL